MYEIALSVAACLRAGTRVDVAWVVESRGFSSRDHSEALAITPGGGRIGGLLSGSVNDQLGELSAQASEGRLADLHVGEIEALAAGLSCGGDARCLLVPAAGLPAELWDRLRNREPVCLITRLDGERVLGTELFTSDTIGDAPDDVSARFARAVSETVVTPDTVVTVLWPVPKLVVVGAGAVAEALAAAAALLGWHTHTLTDLSSATGVIAELAVLDKVVVISHDHDLAGPALATALSSDVGYIGALGSRRTQQARADWLAGRGITDLDRIHGPAGLDIGADTPAEIAVSILAEALALKSASSAGSLRRRGGSIHAAP
ncbi:MAG TPA: XdhC family protein [Mycobacteriales bacterium]|jgi:xanthine dehydrogenase accessory factor|nr:XdhC family protein [Mycobacteriales bacterium]